MNLPEELLAIIFNYVCARQDIIHVRETCKQWALICNPPPCIAHSFWPHPKSKELPNHLIKWQDREEYGVVMGQPIYICRETKQVWTVPIGNATSSLAFKKYKTDGSPTPDYTIFGFLVHNDTDESSTRLLVQSKNRTLHKLDDILAGELEKIANF